VERLVTCPLESKPKLCINVEPLFVESDAAAIVGCEEAIVKSGYVPVIVILLPCIKLT